MVPQVSAAEAGVATDVVKVIALVVPSAICAPHVLQKAMRVILLAAGCTPTGTSDTGRAANSVGGKVSEKGAKNNLYVNWVVVKFACDDGDSAREILATPEKRLRSG